MRIVGGAWRGRTLASPAGGNTRPTADRARQTLFDMLAHAPWSPGLRGARVLDVFAGTGAFGLEALSRGAAAAVFIEQDRAALAALRANISRLDAGARSLVLAADATSPPAAAGPADIAFLDPPYGRGLAPRAIAALGRAGHLAAGAILAVETAPDDGLDPAEGCPPLEQLADRRIGKARLRILRAG